MPRSTVNPDIYTELAFPLEGVDQARSFQRQRPGTCVDALNVRAFDPLTGRARGGSRPGLVRAIPSRPIGNYPIQDLNYLITDYAPPVTSTNTVTTEVTTPPTTTTINVLGQATYSLGSGNGWNMVAGMTGAGQTIGTAVLGSAANVSSGFQFACSCWDAAGNVYVALVNTTFGTLIISSLTSQGVTRWSTVGQFTVSTGSLRNIAGMTVIGTSLFVAYNSGGVSKIAKISADNGGSVNLSWFAPGIIIFSTNSINCLGSIGTVLGVEFIWTTGTPNRGFGQFNSTASSVTFAQNLHFTAWGGTAAQAYSSVCSDGSGYFYTIASVTTNQIRQVALSGAQGWAVALPGSAVAQGLCFNTSPAMLVAVGTGGTYGVQSLSLTTGAVLLGNSSLGTTWNAVGSNGVGQFTLFKNAVASNDIMAVNTSFSAVWGPTTFANTSHFGASVNRTAVTVTGTVPGSTTTVTTVVTTTTPGVSQRNITKLGVCHGEIFRFDSQESYAITNGPGALDPSAHFVFSAQDGTKMFYCDGQNYKWYDGLTGEVAPWTLTAGSFPRDSQNNGCRLIETWNGRIVLSGLPLSSQNWFMSKVADPRNFDTSTTPATTTMAVFGNNSPLGLVGGPIQCMIPYVDNTMIFGLSHQIWLLQGDPMKDGAFVVVTDKIGMPFGRPWCKDPNGQVYFLSSRAGVFKITPNALPVRVSQQIEQLIESVNLSQTIVRMEWDIRAQGLGLWLTPTNGGETTNFFWEERTNAWWPDKYSNKNFNPNCVKAFDGDSVDDRRIFLGCRDGFIRSVSNTAILDDNLPIASFVYFGPIGTRDLDDVTLKSLHARLAEASEPVTFAIYVGNTAEAAFNSDPVMEGTWTAGHNPSTYIRYSGTSVYVRVDCSAAWASETIQAVYQKNGLVRRRA